MKNWTPALLLLLLSCADNEFQAPGPVRPQLLAVEAPLRVVAGWPTSLELRAVAELPEAAPGRFGVEAEVNGPGLAAPLIWRLADDGSAAPLDEAGVGQLTHSGDNVPGDGVFTARFAAGFSEGLGDFALTLRLLDGGTVVDSGTATFARVINSPPLLSSPLVPDTLASGAILELSVAATDPDGGEDLVGVQLETATGTLRSWSLQPANDSLWTLSAGPEIAAGQQGATPFRLVATDQAGERGEWPLEIVLENEAPHLDRGGFELFLFDFGSETWLPQETGDTLRLPVPAEDLFIFNLMLPVTDPQTGADIALVEWAIERAGTPDEDFDWVEMDDLGPEISAFDRVAGDGIWSGGFQLPAGITHPDWVLRIRARDRVGQWAELQEWPMLLLAPAPGSATGRGDAPGPGGSLRPCSWGARAAELVRGGRR
jgi:hypothetical protein